MFHPLQPTRTQLGDSESDPFAEQEITGSPLSADERPTATQVLILMALQCYYQIKD